MTLFAFYCFETYPIRLLSSWLVKKFTLILVRIENCFDRIIRIGEIFYFDLMNQIITKKINIRMWRKKKHIKIKMSKKQFGLYIMTRFSWKLYEHVVFSPGKKREIQIFVNLISKSFELLDLVKVHFSSALKHSTNLEAMKFQKKKVEKNKWTISATNRFVCVIAPTAKCIYKCSTLQMQSQNKT